MQSEVAELPLDGGDIIERVIVQGDLSKLTAQERVTYYKNVCESLGLNPFTRPFDFVTYQGRMILYAKRDCADQLRRLHRISIEITNQRVDGDLYIVQCRARAPSGRTDEDMGAVTIGKLTGEMRANAVLKCITKAKRRTTLSICGLGFLDETEVDGIEGAAPIATGAVDITDTLDQFATEPTVRDLVAEGRTASLKGRKAFQKFWVDLDSEQRLSLAEHREAFWEAAEKADAEPEPVGR